MRSNHIKVMYSPRKGVRNILGTLNYIWLWWVFAWTYLLLFFPEAVPHRCYDFWDLSKGRIGVLTFNCSLCVSEKQGICWHWLLWLIGIFLFLFLWSLGLLARIWSSSFLSDGLQSKMKIHCLECTSKRMQKDLLRSLVVLLRFC